MSRKSFVLILISCFAILTSSFAAESADSLMKQTLAKAKADNKPVFLHIGAPW